jgi:hypothetical protein
MDFYSVELEHWALQAKEEDKLLSPFGEIHLRQSYDAIVNRVRRLRLDYYEGGMQKKLRPLYVEMQTLWLQHAQLLEDQGVYEANERFFREELVPDPDTDNQTGLYRTIINSVRLNIRLPKIDISIPRLSPIQIIREEARDSQYFLFAIPVADSDTPIRWAPDLHIFPVRGILIKKDDYASSL